MPGRGLAEVAMLTRLSLDVRAVKATARLNGMKDDHKREFAGRLDKVPFELPKTRPGKALLLKQCSVRSGGEGGGGGGSGGGIAGIFKGLFGGK